MNFMSLWDFRISGQYYTPTNPRVGIVIMLLYALVLPLDYLEWRLPFQVSMVIFALILGMGGVLKHLVAVDGSRYSSKTARWAAIVVNSFGVVVSFYAIL